MEHPFLVVAIVLVSFIALAQPRMSKGYGYGHGRSYKGHGRGHKGHGHKFKTQYCYPNAVPGDECDIDKRCAYNKKECPNYPGCHLICTNNPYKYCYGRDSEDACNGGGGYECWPDHTGQLSCIDTEGICSQP